MNYYIISKNPPKDWDGIYLLECKHCFFGNDSGRLFFMYCNILKEMPNQRLKIRVLGERWRNTNTNRIRYVDRARVVNAKDIFNEKN